MSAFIVSTGHIDALLSFAKAHRVFLPNGLKSDGDDLSRAGFLLRQQNCRSVNHRYGEANEPTPYEFRWHPFPLTAVEAIKACDCYDYQASETDDYRDTIARQIIDAIRSSACRALPGYSEAPWSIIDGRP